MKTTHPLKKQVLLVCLFLGPLLQLIGDALWLTRDYNYSWNIWREMSYIFFVPAGFLLARLLERKSFVWAMIACALFVIGCFGVATMMPLFRLGGFYPIEGHYEFPVVVKSVLDQKGFAVTLFPLGLCFPVSLVVFGTGFLKHKILNKLLAAALIICGVLFWLGNAGEMELSQIIGDVLLLVTLCYAGYLIYNDYQSQSTVLTMQY
jgi:hypothetical protein